MSTYIGNLSTTALGDLATDVADRAELRAKFASVNFAATSYTLHNPGAGPHTTIIQDALDEAGAGYVGTDSYRTDVRLGQNTYTLASTLTIPAGVRLVGDGTKLVAANTATGWMITMPNANGAVENLYLNGNHGGGARVGAITTSAGVRIKDVDIHATSHQAIKLGAGSIVCKLQRCFSHTSWQDITGVAAPVGALETEGTDHWIIDCNFGCSRNTLSAGGHIMGVLINSSTTWLSNVLSEFNDHAFYQGASASNNMWSQCRGDFSMGHGFWFAGGTGSLVNCLAYRSSRHANNTYDGFFFDGSQMRVSNCRSAGPTNLVRYGFYDQNPGAFNHNVFDSTNHSSNHSTAPVATNTSSNGGARVNTVRGPFAVIGAASTTQNVAVYGWPHDTWALASVAPVNFTNFTNGVTGQRLTILGDGNTTFVHNTSAIRTLTGANTLAAANTMYEFVNRNGVWWQVT